MRQLPLLLVTFLGLASVAHADDLARKLAKVVEDNRDCLVSVSFTSTIDNPFAGFMGGGGRRGGGEGGRGRPGEEGGRGRRGGGGSAQQEISESVTGLILDRDGHVLVAKIETPSFMGMGGGELSMDGIKVKLPSGDEVDATYVGSDARTGFAVVKFDPAGLRFTPLRRSSSSRTGLGEPVVALSLLPASMGNGVAFRHTRVNGVMEGAKTLYLTQESLDDLMACPVYSEDGSLVGLVGPYKAPGEEEEGGRGFNPRSIMRMMQGRGGGEFTARGVIMPLDAVSEILDDPASVATAKARVWTGLDVSFISPAFRALYGGLDDYPGCVNVSSVAADSPAAAAGIEEGDVLLEVDGKVINVRSEGEVGKFQALFADKEPGDTISIKAIRDGSAESFSVTLARAPLTWSESPTHEDTGYGLVVRELTADYARERRVPEGTQGVVVTNITPESPAATAGLRTGDVITGVGGQPVEGLAVWKRAASTGLTLEVDYLRRGRQESATIAR